MMRYLSLLISLVGLSFLNAQTPSVNCSTENHKAFDFWIGSWEVFNKDGTLAGYNEITKIQDNCVLQENWKGAKGNYTGTSNSFYNTNKEQWEQIWLDNQGGVLHLNGRREGNQMILYSDSQTNEKGQSIKSRITWTTNNDGTVRQLWEVITNEKEISVAFDGLYKRKSE